MSSIYNPDSAINDKQPIALAINLGTNVALSLITLGAFCWLRPRNGVIYARKYKSSPQDKRAPRLEEGYFSWMRPVWSCPDEVLVEKIGLDAVVFIRFVRMCRQIFLAMAVIGCGALIPINIIFTLRAQRNMPTDQASTDKVSMLTMAGMSDLRWLWAHVGGVWVFSMIMYIAMLHNYKTFLGFRIRYFESEAYQEDVASRTIMLAGLPSTLQNDDKLLKFMNDMGLSDKPVQALVGRKIEKLPELMDKHKKMVKALEKVVAKYYADPNRLPSKRPTVKVGGFCGSKKVDAIDYYSQQIEELTDQIEMTRHQVSKSRPTNYGFVSYATIHAAHRVAKELSSATTLRKRSKMIDPPELFLSPIPKDIIWFNVANPKQLRKTRRIIVNTAFVVFSLLFFIPMSFLSTIAKLESIVGLIPASKSYFEEHTFVASLVQSLLPVLFMDVLFLLIRKLIVYLAWFQGNITKSSTDRSTLAKFYLFFTLNNLIVLALAGTIVGFFAQIKATLSNFSLSDGTWQDIKKFISEHNNIVELLSKNVIDTSLFWVNYISLRNFGALLDLFQLVSLVLYWFKTTLTPRESKAMNKPDVFDFPLYFSVHMFLLTVALLYSVIAPLVLFFAVVYFSLASLVYKYQLMYVFRTRIETGGRLFRVVYNRLLAALVLFQIVMIGVLNLKGAHWWSCPCQLNYDPKIDYYDYGSARNERHLFKGGKNGNLLVMNFENPVLSSKVVSVLVPDVATKLLSNKVLHGSRSTGRSKEGGRRPGQGKQPSRGKSSLHSQRDNHGHDGKEQEMESFEMEHVRKGSKSNNHFQVLGADPYDSSSRAQSPQQNQQYHSQHVLGTDDLVDDYFDDQKQSLTKSATQRYDDTYSISSPPSQQQQPAQGPKVYGAQDMTSFVAGRYRADRSADPYSYSRSGSNSNTGSNAGGAGSKPSYLELAKMHQTDSYKSTGKATQYEDKKALHLPPVNFPKMQSRSRSGNQQQHHQDPFQNGSDHHSPEHSTPTTPTTPLPQQAIQHQPSPRVGYKDSSALQYTSTSPTQVSNDYGSGKYGFDGPKSTHGHKAMGRTQTQGSMNYSGQSNKYYNNDNPQQHQNQDTYV
ncbi:hypothetical protein BGZ54_003394 [Gamsiella multidivaricata]|nr:hypothetical protein BGZ54_003394 [Gamsiella multidivaricata]